MIFCVNVLLFLCLFFSILFSLVSVSTHSWIENGSGDHQGLRFYCNDVDLGCQEFTEDPNIVRTGMPGELQICFTSLS